MSLNPNDVQIWLNSCNYISHMPPGFYIFDDESVSLDNEIYVGNRHLFRYELPFEIRKCDHVIISCDEYFKPHFKNLEKLPTYAVKLKIENIVYNGVFEINKQHVYDNILLRNVTTLSIKNVHVDNINIDSCADLKSLHIHQSTKHLTISNISIKNFVDFELIVNGLMKTICFEQCEIFDFSNLSHNISELFLTDDLYLRDANILRTLEKTKINYMSLYCQNITTGFMSFIELTDNIRITLYRNRHQHVDAKFYFVEKYLNYVRPKEYIMDFVLDFVDAGFEDAL